MKRILVQAQSDHIESLYKGTPISAIEELVWNALDADAHEVRVDLLENDLGAVVAVRVTDDGTGIDVENADSTFGFLGGSWKRAVAEADATKHHLHGRHGRGRFKAFALGTHVEWRTTTRIGERNRSFTISGDAENPGVFELSENEGVGPATGTEVFVTNVHANVDSLTRAAETVQDLAAKFALYLKNYPDARIYFNGLPVTPIIVQQRVSDYTLTLDGGQTAKLEVIEWKRKFVGAGRLVFAGPDGFRLHERTAGVRTGFGQAYTAYLVSPRFPVLQAENALMMDELHPEVRKYIVAAKKALKAHFTAYAPAPTEFEVKWGERLTSMSEDEKKTLFVMLKKLLKVK